MKQGLEGQTRAQKTGQNLWINSIVKAEKTLSCPLCNATPIKEHNKSARKLKILATEVKLAIFQLHN
jgi:hypothetical protein